MGAQAVDVFAGEDQFKSQGEIPSSRRPWNPTLQNRRVGTRRGLVEGVPFKADLLLIIHLFICEHLCLAVDIVNDAEQVCSAYIL